MTYDGLKWAFYSVLIHPDNNSLCGTNTAWDRRTELEKRHCWFVCVTEWNHALFVMEPSIMKENTETANTVCLFRFSNTKQERNTNKSSQLHFVDMKIFDLFYFHSFQFFFCQHTHSGDSLVIPSELVTQTNQYGAIVRPCSCIKSRQAAVGSFPAFPLQWQSSVL